MRGAETPVATPTPSRSPAATAEAGELPPGLKQILDDVAEVRDLDPPPALKAGFVSRSDLPALLESLITEDDRRLFAQTTTLYRLLGHFRDDQDYLALYQGFGADSILGLYSPVDDELWVVHPDGEVPSFEDLPQDQAATLAHELAHAIQDYHFQLDTVYEQVADDLDRMQVFTSVVEGDAVDTEERYSERFLALPLGGRLFAVGIVPQASDVPLTFLRELLFPYTTGANWVRQLRRNEGDALIDSMIADPPAATAYILHPELLFASWEPAPVTLPDLAGALGPGWERQSGGTLGEFQLGNYLQLNLGLNDSNAGATGWAGDHYDVYARGDESAAVFEVEFADAAEAGEFTRLHEQFIARAGGNLTTGGEYATATLHTGKSIAVFPPAGSTVTFVYASSNDLAAMVAALLD